MFRLSFLAASLMFAGVAMAQNATVAFGGLQHDASLPVEITADELRVDQTTGRAVFTGNVVAGQGQMRLSAAQLDVEYATGPEADSGDIERLLASGGVTFVNGEEAAESREAVYSIGDSEIVMIGDVILTQGPNALSGERLVVDLDTGQGRMEGRVRTIFQTGGE
ncbi:LptA/OstA family protein [Litoreibacter roseus]|uniref:Organic solvent tolerance protein OstA n=1 Tax=Litoreibacter roseus TaxID=2601869 RepID=A0A6N6JH89_9RHOB|nr:LptA/OstA family protein [Litoreibacter roseus]GFE64582.1 organic solvent tolerance protein OstA [Litoreibacter roseus]